MRLDSVTEGRGIARQYLHTFSFALARVLSHALLIVILGRTLTLEEYGVYALIATAIPVGVTAVGLELYAYLAREIPGLSRDQGVSLFKGAFRFQVLLSVCLVGVVLATGLDGLLAARLQLSPFRNVVRLGLLVFPLAYLQREIARYFIATKRIEVSNISQFLCTNSWAYVLLLWVLLGHPLTLPIIFAVWIAGGAISVLYGMTHVSRDGFWAHATRSRVVTTGLAFSLPLLMGTMGFQINNVSGRYVISYFRSLAEAGGFSFLQTLVTTGGVLTYTIVEAILRPRIVEADNLDDLRRRDVLLNRLLRYSWLLLLPVMLVLLVAGRELLALISRPEYVNYLGLVPYFAATTLAMASSLPFSAILFLQRRTGLMGAINLLGGASNVGLSIMLVPSIGSVGASLAGLLAFVGVLIANCGFARRAGRIVTIGRSRLLQAAAAGVAMGAVMAGGRALWMRGGAIGGAPVGLLVLGVAGLLTFAVVAWAAGGFEPNEKRYLLGLVGRGAQHSPIEAEARPEGDVYDETEP